MFASAPSVRTLHMPALYRAFPLLAWLLALAVTPSARTADVNATWVGGTTGNWNVAANWDTNPVFPNNVPDNFSVFIDKGNAQNTAVTFNGNFTISNLTIDTGDSLAIANMRTLTLANTKAGEGTISNSGAISLNAAGSVTQLQINGDVTLNGGGSITMSNNGFNRFIGTNATDRLTNVNNTISGSGNIGFNSNFSLTNQAGGTIIANQAANSLTIDPSGDVVNQGILRANGGNLILSGGTFTNTGGIIEALNASEVRLTGATVQGGTLQTSGTGIIRVTSSSTLENLTTTGTLFVGNISITTTLVGAITNSGTMSLNAAGTFSQFQINGDVTLNGGGSITMTNSVLNRFIGTNPADRLTNVNNTISGAGNIGNNTNFSLTNQAGGTIIANQSVGLVIDPSGDVINQGILRANGGNLTLSSGTFINTGGTIEALTGSEVRLEVATVQGGTLQTSGTGIIRVTSNSTLENLSTTGTLSVNNGVTTNLVGTITNSGTMALNASGSTSRFRINGDVTLTGGGSIIMSDNQFNTFDGTLPADRLTNVNNTISGSGRIGDNTNFSLTNEAGGTIIANQATSLTINPIDSGNVINQGILRANGGNLILTSGTFINTGGTIEALTGSEVQLSIATVQGGTLQTSGTGVIRVTGASTLENLSTTGTLSVDNAVTTTLVGTIANSGTMSLNSSGGLTQFVINGPVLLTGGGSITMSNNASNRFSGGTGVLTNVNNTISGAGLITNMSLTNQAGGTIIANQATALIIDHPLGGSFTNNGTLRALSGSTLQVIDTPTNFSGGTLTGGTYEVFGTGTAGNLRIAGLNITTNAATILLDGPLSNLLNHATGLSALTGFNNNQGTFTIRNDRDLTTPAAFTNSGTMIVGTLPGIGVEGSVLTVGTGGAGTTYTQTQGRTGGTGAIFAESVLIQGGIFGPGASPGEIEIQGNLNLTTASFFDVFFEVEIGGLAPGQFDHALVTGTVDLGQALLEIELDSFTPGFGNSFTILTGNGGVSDLLREFGSLQVLNNGDRVDTADGLGSFRIQYTGNQVILDQFVPNAVPEPGSLLLCGAVAAGGAFGWWRKRRCSFQASVGA